MPSNHLLINNSLEYIVPDSKMEEFIKWLGENGEAVDTGLEKELDEIIPGITSSCSQSLA